MQIKTYTYGLKHKRFFGKAQAEGQLHISDLKKYPLKAVGCANDINPPTRIFYGTKAIVTETFTVRSYIGMLGNNFPHDILSKDTDNGRLFFEIAYNKGDTVILKH